MFLFFTFFFKSQELSSFSVTSGKKRGLICFGMVGGGGVLHMREISHNLVFRFVSILSKNFGIFFYLQFRFYELESR